MKKEYTILILVSALFCSILVGYYLTRPVQNQKLVNEQAALGRFTGDLGTAEATTLPVPDGLFQISNDVVLAPVADEAGQGILYYHAENGFVSRADIESRQNTVISNSALPGLRDVIWSPNQNQVVTVFSGQARPIFQYFNYETRDHGSLPASVVSAAFSPDGNQLALIESFGDQNNVIISKTDGTSAQTILKTHLAHISIAWPKTQALALTAKDDVGVATFYLLSLEGGLTKIIDSESGLRTAWSHDGSKLLYSTLEEGLVIYDINTGLYGRLPLDVAADKCSWYADSLSIACAVEEKGEIKLQKLSLSNNSILTIASNLIISPSKLFFSPDQKFLVILSAGDHTLYALKVAN